MLPELIILCVAGAAAWNELPKLFRQRMGKEIAVFLIMLAGGTILSLMAVSEREFPSPLKFIEVMYGPINHWFDQWLG
ncbi:hypothetical protein G8C92_19240 [Paenibacillus donghaensis]|jgi:hypothetical protein|uniref:hypothetical protein n=1 Tax=Paenibacillus donghaensis TaxID=414771 RepID=UPI0018836E81|nr:hypothetical protein [Paenibacillus donghaensis]MBE9916154.1 hypothetical protein [Paenibacillus donghaensis]